MAAPLDVKAIREALGLTQKALAKRVGVNKATVWRWENWGVPKTGVQRAFLEDLKEEARQSQSRN